MKAPRPSPSPAAQGRASSANAAGAAAQEGSERETLAALRASVERFASSEIRAREIDRAGAIPARVRHGLAELGLFGVTIPDAYGGAGLGLRGACAVIETLARHDRAVAVTVGLHLGLGTRGLATFGSERLRERYLPSLASGDRLAAFATTEAGAGSDLAAIRTRAEPFGDGRLRLEGEKIFVTNGGLADLFTVTAATPGLGGARRGQSLILVERTDPGVTIGGEEHKLGLRGSSTTPLHLDGVELPLTRILGDPGRGPDQLVHVLSWGRTVMAAGCVGAAGAALDLVAEHVVSRHQFGRPLAAFEVVREQVADLAALVFAMGATVQEACRSDDRERGGDDVWLALASTVAKVACSEGGWEVCDMALQLHGGGGYIEESGLPLLLRDARITRIFEGANDVLAIHAGGVEAVSRRRRAPLTAEVGSVAEPLAVVADAIAGEVADRRAELLARHGVRLLGQQALLHRLGRLVVLRETCDAAVRRADGERTPPSLALATHWLDVGRRRLAWLLAPTARRAGIDGVLGDVLQGGAR